jgi:hypothetical protein
MGMMKNLCRILVGKPEEVGYLGTEGRIILKRI